MLDLYSFSLVSLGVIIKGQIMDSIFKEIEKDMEEFFKEMDKIIENNA